MKDMKTIDSKSKVKTEILRTFKLDKRTVLTIEEITEGKLKGYFTVRTKFRKLFLYKYSSLGAYRVETKFNGDIITKIEYPTYKLLDTAIIFAKKVKQNRYNEKI